jgi:hypothetical protein
MKKLPTPEELGIKQLHFSRFREVNGWSEVIFSGSVELGGYHVNPHKPDFLGYKPSHGTLDLVREVIKKAKSLGYDAWMCNNNPRNGGWINAKEIG